MTTNSSHQYESNHGGLTRDWRIGHEITYCRNLIKNTIANHLSGESHEQVQPSSALPTFMESLLFEKANSMDDYVNVETLYHRMQTLLNEIINMDGSFSVSPGGSNLNTNSNLIYSSQSHANNNEFMKQNQTSNLVLPQLVSSEISKGFNNLPTWRSSVSSQDLLQYEPQKLDFQNNLAQGDAWFVTHDEQFVGCKRKALNQQPQCATSPHANHVPFGNTEAMSCPTKRGKMESGFGVPSIPSSSFEHHAHHLFRPSCIDPLTEVLLPFLSPSEVQECKPDQFTNLVPDSTGIRNICEQNNVTFPFDQISVEPNPKSFGMIDKNMTHGQLGSSFWSPLPSKALEVCQISVEPIPKSNDMIESNNLMGIDFGSSSSMHTLNMVPKIEDTEGTTGIYQVKTNSAMEVYEEKVKQSNDMIESNDLMGIDFGSSSSMHTLNMVPKIEDTEGTTGIYQVKTNSAMEAYEEKVKQSNDMIESNNLMGIDFGSSSSMHTLNMVPKIEDTEGTTGIYRVKTNSAMEVYEEKGKQSNDMIESNNLMGIDLGSSSSMHTLNMVPKIEDTEGTTGIYQVKTNSAMEVYEEKGKQEMQAKSSYSADNEIEKTATAYGFGCDMIPPNSSEASQVLGETNVIDEIIEPIDDQEKQSKSSNATANVVSLIELFTSNQIKEHIMSLRKQSGQIATGEEMKISTNACQLCAKEKLFFAQVPIYCLGCGYRIKQNSNYYYINKEEFDAGRLYCSNCFKQSKGGHITLVNGSSIPKTLLKKKKNDEVLGEAWVECDKCKRWQHQICALYNSKIDLDSNDEYTCPVCCIKEIENGTRVPSPDSVIFRAKDLPRTTLSDYIEKRLFERLIAEKTSYATENNLVEALTAENLSVREVLSLDKQLNVDKRFMDILPKKKTYPANFHYRSRVILLFQQIEGADVCIFGMYVQEYGSECGYPNQRCVYISYLDSVKYFRPHRRTTVKNEALRTFVYHEIMIGYLDFVKKRGFATCFIWSCPPEKGVDYILYCHPTSQKTPKKDHLRKWYESMLTKAAEENIVVGLTNMYDHLFVPTGKSYSKVTTSQLPYFDGDHWSVQAVNLATNIGKESGGDFYKSFKKLPRRSLKDMGHDVNPPKSFVKDIVVMQKLGQHILPHKEDFIVAHLHYSCMHCHEVIVFGKKRWFCSECNKIQECERCHSYDVHTTAEGKVHRLGQVLMDDVPLSTDKNNITIYSSLFENRNQFLDFCQKNKFQFDTLRHAKYSSMMILHHLKNPPKPLCHSENQEPKKNPIVEKG